MAGSRYGYNTYGFNTYGYKKKKKRGGTLFILVGLILIGSAAGLTLYNIWDGERAACASADILEKLDAALQEDPGEPSIASPVRTGSDEIQAQSEYADNSMYYQAVMPVETIDGYDYIGILEIPSLSLRLPVMDHWDYERLRISPCRYSGSYYENDLVICAHNYQRHFSPVKSIGMGEDIYFITVDKVVYHYVVTNIETVAPTAVSQMTEKNPAGADWDMTLFTCNTGGQTRCAVRCARA